MKHSIPTLPIFLLLMGILNHACSGPTKSNAMDQQEKQSSKVLRHMVLFKFKDTASERGVQKLNEDFNELPSFFCLFMSSFISDSMVSLVNKE